MSKTKMNFPGGFQFAVAVPAAAAVAVGGQMNGH